jgi:hypothetical protein
LPIKPLAKAFTAEIFEAFLVEFVDPILFHLASRIVSKSFWRMQALSLLKANKCSALKAIPNGCFYGLTRIKIRELS